MREMGKPARTPVPSASKASQASRHSGRTPSAGKRVDQLPELGRAGVEAGRQHGAVGLEVDQLLLRLDQALVLVERHRRSRANRRSSLSGSMSSVRAPTA